MEDNTIYDSEGSGAENVITLPQDFEKRAMKAWTKISYFYLMILSGSLIFGFAFLFVVALTPDDNSDFALPVTGVGVLVLLIAMSIWGWRMLRSMLNSESRVFVKYNVYSMLSTLVLPWLMFLKSESTVANAMLAVVVVSVPTVLMMMSQIHLMRLKVIGAYQWLNITFVSLLALILSVAYDLSIEVYEFPTSLVVYFLFGTVHAFILRKILKNNPLLLFHAEGEVVSESAPINVQRRDMIAIAVSVAIFLVVVAVAWMTKDSVASQLNM